TAGTLSNEAGICTGPRFVLDWPRANRDYAPMSSVWVRGAFCAVVIVVSIAAGAWVATAQAAPPSLERVACWFKVPKGHAADCYWFTVLESRAKPDGPTLRLPVAVLKTPAKTRHSDPIVHLSGGPGYGAWLDKDRISYWWEIIDESPWL